MKENDASIRTVDQIQRELRCWVETHIPDLRHAGHQSTIWYGVMQKCSSYVEALIRASADRLILAVGPSGDGAVRLAGNGKPLDLLTLGQYMKLFQALEEPLLDLMAQEPGLAIVDRPLFGKAGVQLVDRVSRLRNDFTHGRWPVDGSNELTIEFLEKAKHLCDAPIIKLAIELERDTA